MLEQIKQDHRNMTSLLSVLRQKLAAIKAERPIRYNLMRDVLTYLHDYADKHHHPIEDVIYGYYVKHKSEQQKRVFALAEEHEKISAQTDSLCTMVDMILLDAVVPQQEFMAQLEKFIRQQEHHMEQEEKHILPLLEQNLTDADWQAIYAELPYEAIHSGSIAETLSQLDPLFGEQVAEHYKQLHERLQESE